MDKKTGGEERLQELYEKLADLIPEALAEDFVGMGYGKGRYYDEAQTRILVVEKIPRTNQAAQEDDKDFTGVVSRIAGTLLGEKGVDWQEHVAWTYLYKLAPKAGKPDNFIYNKQKALCEEIIKAEIETLEPTHVLFLTGWSGVWDFDLPVASLLKGEAAEGWGISPGGTRYVVTRHAVRKPEDKFALDILERFRLLDELERQEAGI